MKKLSYLIVFLLITFILPFDVRSEETSVNATTTTEEPVESVDSLVVDTAAMYEEARRAYVMDSMRQATMNRLMMQQHEESSGNGWRWGLRLGVLGIALIGLIVRLSRKNN